MITGWLIVLVRAPADQYNNPNSMHKQAVYNCINGALGIALAIWWRQSAKRFADALQDNAGQPLLGAYTNQVGYQMPPPVQHQIPPTVNAIN